MKNRGFTLLDSLLFFGVVLLIINYLCLMSLSLSKLNDVQKDYDKYYEEAYKDKI